MRVSLFITCFNDTLFPETGKAVVTVLERLGHSVDFPLDQTCCGQMHMNSGYGREAAALARGMAKAFAGSEIIVAPSTSCVAMIRQHYPKFAAAEADPALADEIAALAPRVMEFSEFLTGTLGIDDVGARYPHRVTYHASCNGLRMLGLGDAPTRLLKAVRDIDYVELSDIRECCGFGGTFAIKNADTSAAILATGAEICTAADNSCLMQIGGALSRRGTGVRALHLAEILAATGSARELGE